MRYRESCHPVLYEINARVWLADIAARTGAPVTLADVPDEEIVRLERLGIDLVWLMGIWRTGRKAAGIARAHPDLQEEFRRALPDLSPQDIDGSPYAVAEYSVDPALGGTRALALLRGRLAHRGIGLILDFVTNHTGVDHPWTARRPEIYVQGDEEDLERAPGDFFRVETASGAAIIAHGRDPHFLPWTDTAQINFLAGAARSALGNVLRTIADQCDGVRCDMAMLALEEVFRRTWEQRALRAPGPPAGGEFWAETIAATRERHPGFLFIAEVYWGLEPRLQDLGFDYTYDKELYDRLQRGDAAGIRGQLGADPARQRRAVRFIENHDEPRAAAAFPPGNLRAAALVAAAVPGLAFFHEGQFEGRRIKVPVQLRRRPGEPVDAEVLAFYERLLAALHHPVFRRGACRPVAVREAWAGNATWDQFIVWEWQATGIGRRLLAVNYGPSQGQCYAACGAAGFEGRTVNLRDLLGPARYLRDGDELLQKGLYLDLPPGGHHLFEVTTEGN